MVFVESPSNRAFAISAAICAVVCGVLKASYQGAAAADADGDEHLLLVSLQTGQSGAQPALVGNIIRFHAEE